MDGEGGLGASKQEGAGNKNDNVEGVIGRWVEGGGAPG